MRSTVPSARLLALTIVTLTALAGCASKPTVRTHAAPDFQPGAYRSFGFFQDTSRDRAGYASFARQYLEAAIARELQARGYESAGQPDLLVNFHLVAREKLEVTSTPAPYYGWRRGYTWRGLGYETDVRSFTEGTLIVDLVDRARNQLVWEGVAVGTVTEKKLENLQPTLDAAVAAIFARFPAPARYNP